MNNTHKISTNALGVSPSQFEQIKNLQYLLGELERNLTWCKTNRVDAIKYKTKPIGPMKADLSERLKVESIDLYKRVREACLHLNYDLTFSDEVFSACCGCSPENLGEYDSTQIDVCPKCKEPTDFI